VARLLPDELKGKELVPLCIAAKPGEAKEIEAALDRAGIDYTFEITPFSEESFFGVVFGGIKKGVMFLVEEDKYEFCLGLLERAGLSRLIVE
jgi:hypothetical protein